MKICSKCKKEKALDQFKSDKRCSDGHSYWCKDCTNAKYKIRENEKIIIHRCSKCKEEKFLDQFKKDNRGLNGHASWCKNCNNARNRAYRQTEHGRKIGQRYRQSEYGYKIKQIDDAQWRKKNPEKRRAHIAVQEAVRLGKLPKASSLACELCEEQAKNYHHDSYEPEDHLNVQAFCCLCHTKEHKKLNKKEN